MAIAYDCLFPWTIGGAERWYRALAEGLVEAGARVTYLTRPQWDEPPRLDGIEVVAVRGPRELYHPDGRRRTDQPIRYGAGLLLWLLRHRRSYDVVHLANFPYFSLLAARLALAGARPPLFVDWHEVWPAEYWTAYGGPVAGRIGYVIQELCVRLTPRALVFWDHNADRLRAHGFRGEPVVLPGLMPEAKPAPDTSPLRAKERPPLVFFSGRHIKDKGVRLLPGALRIARESVPDLRMVIAGEGRETPLVRSMVEQLGVADAVEFVGKLSDEELFLYVAQASCVAVPSVREGYGLAPVEANAYGTPAIVTAGTENAAVAHIVEGRNGFVVEASPEALADGIVRAVEAGPELRRTTVEEYARMSVAKGMQRSVDRVVSLYVDALAASN